MAGELLNYKNWICFQCAKKNTTEYAADNELPIMKKVSCENCQTTYDIILPSKKVFERKKAN